MTRQEEARKTKDGMCRRIAAQFGAHHRRLIERRSHDKSQQLGAIAAQCGWKTENALRTAFLKRYGKSMRDWRRETVSVRPHQNS